MVQHHNLRRYPFRRPQEWISESYAVRDKYFHKIVKQWGHEPTVDAFASKDNAKFAIWWGSGSPHGTDAFQQSWKGQFLWMNPPYSRLPEVVAKLKEDQAHSVLVVPNWQGRKWYQQAWQLRLTDLWFPTGTKIFELNGKPCKGTLWPTRALLVCGRTSR